MSTTLVFRLILVFTIALVVRTYYVNDPCYKERAVHTIEENVDLISVNTTAYFPSKEDRTKIVEIQGETAYFIGNCQLAIYFNTKALCVPRGYEFGNSIKYNCKFDDGRNVNTALPRFSVLRNGRGEEGPWTCSHPRQENEVYHPVPDQFNDTLMLLNFSHIVADGPVKGFCKPWIAFGGDSNAFGNLTFAIEVKGCPAYKYGLKCDKRCQCSTGVKCHNFNGECLCPKGLSGKTCDQYDPVVEMVSHVYPTWASDVEINCTVHGSRNSTIKWAKDGKYLQTVSSKIDVEYQPRPIQSTLLLRNVTGIDNGVYVCTADVINGTDIEKTVNVTVINIRNPFIEAPSNHTVKIGGNVTLFCRVKPAAGPIAWVKGGQIPYKASTFLKTSGNIRIINNLTIGFSELNIYNVTLDDESIYRCVIGHIFEGDTINSVDSQVVVYVDPLEPFPRITGNYREDIYDININTIIEVECETKLSKPITELTWFLDKLKVDSSNTEEPSGRLFNVTSYFSKTATVDDNNRLITCVASSPSFGRRNSSIKLNVTYLPIVNVYPKSIKVRSGDDVILTCNASANPLPVSYNWTIKLEDGTEYFYPTGILELNDVGDNFDDALVICWATNTLGSASVTVDNFIVVGPGPRLDIIMPVTSTLAVIFVVILYLLFYKHRHVLQTKMAGIYIRKFKQKKDNFKYDFYISYKSDEEDEEFVVKFLVPWLEQKGYTVCVDYKCFLPGDAIKDSINNNLCHCRTIIIVLSPRFFKCRWCNYELNTAYTSFHEGQLNILPIIFDNIQEDAKTNFIIKTLFNSITYLQWPRGDDNERLLKRFWRDIEHFKV